jgi:hypothetical protein
VEGILSSVVNGVIVAWLYHPGGGVPPTAAMIQNAVRAKPEEYTNAKTTLSPEMQQAEFVQAFHDAGASGPNTSLLPREFTTSGQFLVYQRVSNSAGAPGDEQVVQHFPMFIQDDKRPIAVELYCDIPNSPNNNITVQVYDTDQVLVAVTGSPINPTTGWEHKTVTVDRTAGTWDNGKPYEVRLLFNLDPGQSIDLGRLKVNYWPFN